MSLQPLSVYALAVAALFLKALLTLTILGRARLREGRYHHPEDAAHWGGEVAEDTGLAARAQRLLLNDGETQVYFLALGGAYVALGAWSPGAPIYFGVYVLSRIAHAVFLLKPRQPLRNRLYSLGLLVLLAMAAHVTGEAIAG